MKDWDFLKKRKKPIGWRFTGRSKFPKIISIFREIKKNIASIQHEEDVNKSLESKNNNNSVWKLNKQSQLIKYKVLSIKFRKSPRS